MRISDWSSDVCSSDLQWLLCLTLWVVLRGHILSMLPRTDCSQGEKPRSEEHTSELQSLMRISYAVFCLKKKKKTKKKEQINMKTNLNIKYNKHINKTK